MIESSELPETFSIGTEPIAASGQTRLQTTERSLALIKTSRMVVHSSAIRLQPRDLCIALPLHPGRTDDELRKPTSSRNNFFHEPATAEFGVSPAKAVILN